jgi:hypothetical protein
MTYEQSPHFTKFCAVILLLFAVMYLSACDKQTTAKNQGDKVQPAPYKILYDEMTAKIIIGVVPEINEQQLRATLVKVANDHQDDAARDYLIADHLWIDAYLVRGEWQSSIPAGRLGRYVPPRNPDAKDEDPNTRKEDQIFITLEEAKRTWQ